MNQENMPLVVMKSTEKCRYWSKGGEEEEEEEEGVLVISCSSSLWLGAEETLFINTQDFILWEAQSSESCNIDIGLLRNNSSMWQELHRGSPTQCAALLWHS